MSKIATFIFLMSIVLSTSFSLPYRIPHSDGNIQYTTRISLDGTFISFNLDFNADISYSEDNLDINFVGLVFGEDFDLELPGEIVDWVLLLDSELSTNTKTFIVDSSSFIIQFQDGVESDIFRPWFGANIKTASFGSLEDDGYTVSLIYSNATGILLNLVFRLMMDVGDGSYRVSFNMNYVDSDYDIYSDMTSIEYALRYTTSPFMILIYVIIAIAVAGTLTGIYFHKKKKKTRIKKTRTRR